MGNQRLLVLLVSVMLVVVTFTIGVTIYLLYDAAFEAERARLVDAARRNAHVINGLVEMEAHGAQQVSPEKQAELVNHVIDLYSQFSFEGFGRTGSFMIGRRIGNQIQTMLYQRLQPHLPPAPVPFNSGFAEPMRQALLGNSGSLVGPDFKGEPVLAAYEPIPKLGLGIVAKVDVPELRAPFVRAGLIAAMVAALATLLGAALFSRLTAPFIRRLTESEVRSRQVIDTAADAIVTVSAKGIIETMNPAAESLFGWPEAELRGSSINLLLPDAFPHQTDPPQPSTWTLVDDARLRSPGREMRGLHADGREFPVEASFRETVIQRRQCFTAVCRDITLRKEAEAQIVLARDQAERSNQAKTEFMAMISHELRTPMNGVLGMTGLLQSTALSDEQARYAEAVRASGVTLLNIINDILDYSKIEAGMLELEQEDFELAQLMEEVTDLLQIQTGSKGIELAAFIAPAVPPVLRGDPGRLRQLLFNLVGNAVKFTETGGVVVEATAALGEGDRVDLRCEVTDTGIGIPAGIGGRLFERFTQADSSTSRRYGGTGLGLAIAKQITSLMGGEIGYESDLGRGSRFWFTARLSLPAGGPPAPHPPPDVLAGKRALLVDGLALNRGLLRKQLESMGLVVNEANGGAEAIERFITGHRRGAGYEIVVANRALQDMGGEDLLRGIRRMEGGRDCATVLLAAASDYEPVTKSGEPVSCVLAKPVHQRVLREGLLRLFTGTAPTTRPTAPHVSGPVSVAPTDALRILLAEDNPVNQLLAAAYLRKMGHEVKVVGNGHDAVAAVQETRFDLVLMDVHMPDLDGLEAAARIRAQGEGNGSNVPIIAVTADVMRGDRERFLAAGMNDHIAKPFDIDSLAEIVRRWTGDRDSSPATHGADSS